MLLFKSVDHGLTQFTDNTITPDPLTNCANVRSAVDTLFEILITTLEATNPRTYFDGLKRTIPQSPAVEFAIVEEFNARIEIEGIVNQGVPNPYPAWLVGDTVQGITSGQTARVVGIISQTTNGAGSTIAQTLRLFTPTQLLMMDLSTVSLTPTVQFPFNLSKFTTLQLHSQLISLLVELPCMVTL